MKLNLLAKTLIAIAPLSLLFLVGSGDAHSNSSGAPAARTGSPSDGANCRACHAGATAVSANLISSDIPVDGYVPGTTYNITASMTSATSNKFGFELSPQGTGGAKIGTLIATEPTRTQLLSSGKYITHKAAGNAGTANAITWTFQWTAPATGTGAFTFYGAFLAANANNSSSGDAVFVSTLPVQENTTSVSLAEKTNEQGWGLFPIPCSDLLKVKIPAEMNGIISITILGTEGAVKKKMQQDVSGSASMISIDMSDLPGGAYIALITGVDGKSLHRKVIKL